MNKIFKVIWSKSKQCYIVVSEIAKNKTGKKKIVVAGIFAALAMVNGGDSTVAAALPGGVTGQNAMWIGNGATVNGTIVGQNSIAIGRNANSKSAKSIAIGSDSVAEGVYKSSTDYTGATAIGAHTNAKGAGATALGVATSVNGDYSIGLGWNTNVSADNSIAIGVQSRSTKEGSTAMGPSARGYGEGSLSLGYQALAGADVYGSGINVINNPINDNGGIINSYAKWGDAAIGLRAVATGGNATALGRSARAAAANAIAIGGGNGNSATDNTEKTEATGEKATAIGYNAKAGAEKSTAIGAGATANGLDSFAGASGTASGAASVAIGKVSKATDSSATAVGDGTSALGQGATALGSNATAKNGFDLAVGRSVTSEGGAATVVGYNSNVKGNQSIGIGSTIANSAQKATAIGYKVTVSGSGAIGIGSGTDGGSNVIASGSDAIALGTSTLADSEKAIAIGANSKGTNIGATALGRSSEATGASATALGSLASATGSTATAVGMEASATGNESLAIGKKASATSGRALAVGTNTTATGASSVAVGSGAGGSGIIGFAGSLNSTAGVVNTNRTINYATTADGDNAVALGFYANAKNSGVAVGQKALAATGGVAIGKGVLEDTGNNHAGGVVIGQDSASTGVYSLAMGFNAFASGSTSMAIGHTVSADGGFAVAMGRKVSATGTSTAIGHHATATNGGLAIGSQGNDSSNDRTTASATGAVAIGKNAKATSEDAVAIGTNAQATLQGAVALGSGSTTATGATSQGSTTINGITYNFAGATGNPNMQVSVGSAGATRQIKNVAAGEVSATSTDAINGSQLYAVASAVKPLKYVSVNSAAAGTGSNVDNDGAQGGNSIAIGPSSTVTRQNGIAIGSGAQSLSEDSVVIGRDAKAETKTGAGLTTTSRAIVIGSNSRVAADVTQGVAIGSGLSPDEGAVVTGDQSIAIGGNVKVDGHSAIAIGGDDARKAANQLVSYTNTDDTEVTGTLQTAIQNLTGYNLSNYKGTTASHAGVAYGTSALAGNAGVAIGTAADSMTRMNDKGQVVNNKPVTNAVAIGTGARANFDNSVAIGGGSNTDHYATKQVNAVIDGVEVKWSGGENISPGDVVSFGAKGFERQLKNVAPGEVSQTSTDAVNGSQIYSLARKVTNIMNGGSGSVVNVNSLGQPLSKVVTTENGNKVEKYYRTSDIREDGTVPTGTSEQTPTSLALVNVSEPNANLRTTKPRILGNVANGVNDNDAVNVSQLKAATVKYFSVNSTVGDNRNNDKATGTNAIAVGPAAQAAGNNTVSVGYAAGYQADGKNNVGIGTDAGRKLSGDNNISIGSSSGNNSVDNNPNKRTTYTNNSVMLGNEAKVIDSSAQNSIDNVVVIGNRATSSGTSSVVLGTSASGTDKNTIAIGNSSKATSISAVALGNTANATGLNAMALGLNTNASDENSVAIGNTANASAKNTLAMGTNTKALSEAAIALGTNAESSGFGSIAIGEKSKAQPTTATSPAGSVAIGYRTESTGDFAVALGSGNGSYKGASANGVGTVAVGTATVTASGRNFQTVVGFGARTNNEDAAAFGHEAKAYSEKSLALGSGSSATVTGGVALGSGSVADTDKNKKGFDQITGRTDTYAGLKDEAFTSTAGAISVGNVANKVTRQITGVAAGTNDTDAVNVAQLKSVNLAFTGNTGNGGDVNLSQSKLALNGDNQYITTKADGKTLTISGKKQEITVSNGVASASSGMADASNVAQAITQAVSDAKYNWKLSANGQSSTETIAKGDTVDFSGDNNITVSRTGKNISTKLNDTITVDSVNAKKKVTVGTGANQIALDGTLGVATVGASGPNQIIMNGSSGIIQGNKFIGNSFKAGRTSIDNDGLTIANGPSVLATGINAGNKQITGVTSGGTIDTNAANIGDVKKAVANVSQNLNISDGTNNSSVALKSQTLTVAGTGAAKATVNNQTITIDVAEGTLTPNTTNGTVTGTTGVAKATEVAAAINNTNTVLGNKITKNAQDIATNTSNITANKNQITTNTTNIATNTTNIAHTIALADDKGTSTTAKSLKDGNVSFNIKGDNKYISTAASGNDVTLTVNEQAIKDAAKSASSFKVKANTHAEEEVKGGDTIAFNNGDNIEISQTGKTFTIGTAKNITVDTVTAGNTVINTSGLTNGTTAITGTGVTTDKVTVGGISIDKTAGINAGGKVISNVASGNVNNNATDNSNAANIGDVKQAVANLSQNLNITDGTNNGTVDLKNQKLNVAGANGVTATVNNQTITVGLDANTVNATTKGIGLTADTGSTGNKYLKDGDVSFAVTGDGNLVSTSATAAGVKVAVDAAKVKDLAVAAVTVSKDAQADNPITVTPTAGINSKDYAIGIDTTKLAAKTDLTYRANSAADANAKKVSLSKGLDFVDGGSTVATVDNDGKVSFDLNTVTKNQINTNTTDIAANKGNITKNTAAIATNTAALARNISLGADTGTASSQSLSTADVAFNVKGATGDFVSTNMNGNTVEISTKRATINSNATTGEASVTGNDGLATAQNVADAINKAADAAKAGAAWNITTNSSTTDKTAVKGGDTVDLVNGDNIEITQDGTDKKKITVATKKDITVDSVTANNKVTVGSGANKITLDGTDGSVTGKAFTGTTFTGTSFTGTSFTAGNTVINTNGLTNGTTAITGTGVTTDNVTVGGISIDKTAGINAGNKVISNVASGGTTLTNAANIGDVQNAVANLSQNLNITDGTHDGTVDLKNQKLNIAGANGVTATVNNQTITVGLDADTVNATTKGIGLTADTGSTGNKYLKDGDVSFAVTGDGSLVSTSATAAGVKVAVNSATITAGADGTITGPTTDGVATAKNVADAINAAKKASKTEITANTGEAANAATGNVTLTSSTAADGHTIYDVKLNDKVTLGTGANAVTIDGTTGAITGKTATIGGVTVNGTANTIGGLSNTTWNGTAVSGRAATEDQLKAVADAAGSQTWEITADKKTGTSGAQTGTKENAKVGKDDTVSLIAGENLTVDQASKNFTYSLNKDLVKMSSATFEATGGKTTVIKGDSIVQTDGANVNTSNATSNTITDGTNTSTITAGKAQIGTVGIDGVVSKISTGGTNAVVVNGADGTIKTGNVTVTGGTTNDITGLSNTTLTATDFATKGRAATEEQLKAATGATTLKFTGDVATNTGSVNLKDDTFGIKGDNKYISTDVNGKNVNLTVSEAEVKKSAVAAVTVSTDTTDANNPLTVTPTTSADGTTKDYKVTIDGTKIANKTNLSYKANGGTAKQVSLADGLNFKNGTLTTASIDDNGVVKYDVNTASITAGTDGTITGPTTDGVATAKNVADAINAAKKASKTEITANTGEAANATTGNVTLTSTTASDGHTIYDVKLNDKVTLGSGANAVTVDGTAAKVNAGVTTVDGATGTITTGGTNSIKVDGATGTVTGLTNKDWTPGVTKAVTGRAATEDQLQKVADAASSQTWNITADKAGTTGAQTGTKKNATVGKDETVELVAGDNLTINQDERKFTYSLNKDLAGLTSVSIGTGTTETIKLDGATGKITAKNAVIGGVTVDGDNNHVTGLANTTWNGTATTGRAATEDQLKAVAETAKTTTDAVNLKFTGDTNTSPGVVNLKDDTFGIKGDGKYISTDVNGKNVNLTVSEAEVKKSAVAAVTVSTDTTDTNNPLTVTPTASADGTTKDYKVTIDGTKIANKTNLSYKANNGTAKQVSLADGLDFTNGTLTTASIDNNGVVKYDVNTAAITAGADGTITGPTTDGVATAKNVADAINIAKKASKTEITANTGEAANATTGNVTLTSTTAADGHTIYDVKLNDKVTLGTGANVVMIDGTTGAITGKTATIGGVTVNGTANTIGGLSNTTWNGTATTGRAATEDQLKAVADAAGSQTWNITADKAGTTGNQTGTKKNATVGKDETVELVAGDNLTINQDERKFTYSLNKDLAGLTSVSIGTGTTETIKLDGATGKITAKNAVIGGVTVDGDNNHVTGLANTTWNGTATTGRAATEDQLKAVAETAKTTTDAVNLKFTGDTNTSPGVVNLKDDTLGVVGDGKYVSTDANGKNLTVKVSEAEVKKSAVAAVTVSTDTTDANNPLTVTPTTSADGTTKDYKVTIDGTKIANKTNLSYKANGGTAKQVSLADGLNFKNGTLTTASIDDNGVVKYDVNTASITAGTDGTITGPTTDGVATAKNVADAINAAKKASKTEITANTGEAANATTGNVTLTSTTAADGHTIYDVKLNDKVTLGSGANAVTIDGTAGKATIGSSVINGVNNTFTTGGAKAVTLDGATGTITGTTANIGGITVNGTANTIGGLSNTTWNGTATTGRAATEDQLKAVADAAGSQTWEITADKDAATSGAQTGTKKNAKVGKDDKVQLIAGENLTVNQNERDFTYSLNKDLVKMNSATFEATGGKTTVIKGDSIVQTDGANVNTSNATSNTITDGTNTSTITAGKAQIGTVGIDGVVSKISTGGTNAVVVNGADGTIKTGNVTVTGGTTNDITGLSNTTLTATDFATKGRAATEEQLKAATGATTLKFTGDVATNTGSVNLKDDTFGIKGDGKYISTDVNGKNVNLTVSEAEVKKSAVAAVTVSTDTTDANNPLTVTPTTSADGTTRDYKVTIDGTKIANKTNLSYKANDGTAKQVSLADGLNFKNGTLTTASIDDNGVVKYDVNTAAITAGADGTITGPTTDGVATAQNVADAINAAKKASKTEITANTGEAANATTGNVTLTSTTAADGHTIYDVKLNDKVTLGSGANAVTIDGTAGKATIGSSIVDGVNNTFTTGGASPVTLNGATGTITGKTANIGGVTVDGTNNHVMGLANKDWTPGVTQAVSGRAATEDQLQKVSDAVGAGWKVNTGKVTGSTGESNGATSTKVASGEEVQFQAGNNLVVDQNGKTVAYSLNKALKDLESATFNGTGTNKTVITGDSITQTAGTQTNTSTAGGNTVADGTKSTETTAAGQVIKDGAKSNKSTVSSNVIDDGNGNVNTSNATSNIITDGTNASTITAGKATIGSSIVDGVNNTFTTGGANAVKLDGGAGTVKTGTVTVTGGTTNDITGLSNTTVTAADFATKGRAATEEQLKAVGEQTWQITADKDATTSGAQTGTKKNAKVGKDDKVQLIAGENMTVNQNERDFTFTLNKDLVKMNSATFLGTGTNTTVITGDSITQTAGTQTNTSTAAGNTVADGTKSTETTAAGQVIKDGAKSNKSTVSSNVIDDGTGNVNTSNATSDTITDGTNTSTITAGKATIGSSIIDGVNNTFTTGGASPVTLNGATGTITGKTANIGGVTVDGTNNHVMGLANKDWTPGVTQAVSGRAATEDQLQKVSDAVGAGWKVNTGKVTGSTGESNGATSTKVASGEEVQFQAGNNLVVDQNGKTVAYSLNKALKDLESATFNGTGTNKTVITGDSITQTAGTQTNTSTAGGNTVVDGTKSTETTAAGQVIKDGAKSNKSTVDNNVIDDGNGNVNTSNATSNTITDGTNTTATTSSSVTVKDNAGNSTVITKDNITTGVGGNKITLDGTAGKATIGASVVDGVNNTFTTGGTNAVTMNGAAGTIKTGTVTVTGGTTNDITGLSNTTVNSADFATKGRAATEEQLKAVGEQTWQITADKDATTSGAQTGTKKDAKVGKDDKVQLIAGENMTVNQNERDFTFTLNKDLVKMNSATFEATGGKTTVIKGDSIVQTDGTKVNTSTAGGNTVVDGTKSTATTADGTTVTSANGNTKYAADGVRINTTGKNPVSLTDAGLDNGNNVIKNVASGHVNNDATDNTNAANIADVKKATTTVTANAGEVANATKGNVTLTSTTAADGHTIYDVKLNDKVTLGTGANAVTIDGTAGKATIGSSVIDGVNNTFTTGGANAVKLDGAVGTIKTGTVTVTGGTTNDITGLSNTTVTAADFATKGRAATEEQLKAVGEQTWQITADKDATTSGAQTGTKKDAKVGKDDKVQLIAGENMTVNQNERDFTFTLNKDLVKMNSATFEATGGKTTVIKGDSIVQTDGTKVNTSTAGGNTVADGTKSTETTAAGQVIKDGTKTNTSTVDENTIVDGTKSNKSTVDGNTITDGTNTTVTTSGSVTVKDNAGNSTVITKDNVTTGVGANKVTLDGTAGKATIGSSVIDGVNNTFTTGGANAVKLDGVAGTIKTGTVTVTGGTTNDITGLANTTVNSADFATKGRAATEEQLKAVGEQTWQITADKDATTSGAQTGTKKDAKVGKDDKVQLIAGENITVNQNERDFTFTLNKNLVKMNSATFLGTGTNKTVITGDSITQTAGTQTNTSTAGGNTVADGTKSTETTAAGQVIKDGTKTNTSTVDENTIVDGTKSNKSTVDGNTITDGTNTTVTTSGSVTVKDNAGNSTVITKDNVTTGVGANKVTLDGTAGKATIGSSVIDGVNNTFTTGGANAVKLDGVAGTIKTGTVTVTGGTTNDITGLSNTTVNSADFATKGRAATEEQLKAVGEQTWQITADKDATTSGAQTGTKKDAKVGKDDKVQLIAGENMTVNQNERDFTFTLNKDLVKMNSATFLGTGSNTTVITGNSITQTAGTQTNTSTAAGNTIVNGTKSTETTADGQVIKDGAKSNKSTVDSNVIDDGNGNVNTSNATSNTITDGTNTSTITAGKANIGNIAVDGVNNKITMGTGANPVTLDGANGHLDGLTNTTWVPGVTKATTGRAATEDQLQQVSDAVGAGWKVNTGTVAGSSGVSNGAASTKVSSGEEVKLQAGDNLVIDQNGKTVSYSLNKDLTKMNSATFEATGGKTTVIKGDSIVQTDGGKTNTSNAAGNTVVDGNKSTATTAAGITITDGAKTNTSTADKNVINDGAGNTNVSNATSNTLKNAAGDETKSDAKGVTVKDAAGNNATFTKDGITITKTGKDTVSLTSNGLDNGKNKIVNVAAGVANTDAVNVGQLKEYAAKSTTELTANNGETAGSTKGNIVLTKTTAADGHTIYDNKLNDKITLGTDPTKAVTVDGTTGTVTGLTNKTWTPGSIVSGRAATEDQLKEAVADSGWKAAVDKEGSGQSTVVGTSPEKIKAEETVTFKAGNNMMVTQTGKSISYAVNPELTDMKSATFKDTAGNTTVTNGNGITITPGSANPTNPHAGPVSLTKDGLNNGNNQIKGVAPGTDPTDAVNVSQLNASNANTSQAINQIAGEVQHVGAHAAAMAALKPIQYDPLEPTQVMAGVGNYRGETAAALGLAHYTNENTMFNVGVSVGGNHNMVNAGVTHKFGYSPEKKNLPDRYKAGPISSVYVMQDEVSSLKKENAEQKYVIADQAARLTTLEAENEQQRRELAETKKGLDDLKAAVDKLLASKG